MQQAALEWRQTFNAIDMPVLIVDLSGNIKRLNEAAEAITGLEPDEIADRKISELGPKEPWRTAGELIREIRNNGSGHAEVYDVTSEKTWAITLYLINEFGSVGERAI